MEGIGFSPEVEGIHKDFNRFLKKSGSSKEAKFLRKAVDKMKRLSSMNKDEFYYNLVVSTLGSFYPDPPRIQQFAEPVLAEFLDKRVYRPKSKLRGRVNIFPTEGAANAIIYVFNSLKFNGLVVPGDKIGILTPIFSPYLEMPHLRNYNLEQICIKADEKTWEVPDKEIEKIADPNMRALFLVNPTNPTSLSLTSRTVRKIAALVRKRNPNLIILADNVYAPFVDEFNTLFNALPRNTIGVYSFSKYFGVTGWRLGTIMMHKSNIIDNVLLKNAPDDVNKRYKMLNTKPENIKFIDRLLADSRQVAEAHVAGLSTPQQTQMCLFAMFDLLDGDKGYRSDLKNLLIERMNNLLTPLEYEKKITDIDTNYYIVIDLCKTVNGLYKDEGFPDYLRNHCNPLEFLIRLAKTYGTVLLPAIGFGGPFWSVRVSLANLYTEDYTFIGEDVKSLLDTYYQEYKRWQRKQEKEINKK